ncbi:NAD-dependent epimerase/dehydratase family protein [Actinosynnema sp. NPDC020468]|uniref:NAD-dependent epimerase/dehydratase family protein n=1 Tax=Actinosynnema sp. NPDC020468 TaxID=3154488 RepID=UPI0033D9F654
MRVLVTGWRGYVGRAVEAEAVGAGIEVVRFAGDVRDEAAVRAGVRGVDGVVHLGGLARVRESVERAREYFDVNVGGTLNLLRHGVERFVFASTGSVYGGGGVLDEDSPVRPANPYAASKLAAEEAVRWVGHGVVLRLFNVAGGGDRDDTRVITRACGVAAGRLPGMDVYGDGTAVRDFVHVRDVARAFVHVLATGDGVYNVGATSASVADVLASVARVSGREVPATRKPANPGEIPELRADTSRLRATGWRPRDSALDDVVRDQWLTEPGA